MAALDDLLERVTDAGLRAALSREIAPLREAQTLGLVFERHLPETVRLYGHPVRRGSLVQDLSEPEGPTWRVTRVVGGMARLGRRESSGELISKESAAEDLVVLSRFGEPIYPGLRSVDRIEKVEGRPFHTVINGENYHALQALRYAYEGRIDAIFIDPPYNTGARDWKYNNDYVSRDDLYRHSKWLAMMERRLTVAKDLLNPARSVLVVSIDENEVHRLALLLEDIFPSSKIQMVTAMINPQGATIIDQFSRVDEHLFFVHVGAARPSLTTAVTTAGKSNVFDDEGNQKPFEWNALQRRGGNSRREDTAEKFYPVYVHEGDDRIAGCGDSVALGVPRAEAENPPAGCVAQWPIKRDGSEACWQVKPATFRRYLSEGRIKLTPRRPGTGRWGLYFLTNGDMAAIDRGELVVDGHDERGAKIVRNSDDTARRIRGKTMWTNDAYNARENGTKLLRSLLPGRDFPFPKSLYMVEDALRFYVGDNPKAVVLDFFAGSGTTAHAVMRLNRQDAGERVSISITNNEVSAKEAKRLASDGLGPGDDEWERLGIFEYITRPRITAAVTGTTPDGEPVAGEYRYAESFDMAQGLEENVEFLELTYEDRDGVRLGTAFDAIAPLLWLKAGGRHAPIVESAGPVAVSSDAGYGVLRDPDRWPEFVELLKEAPDVRYAFICTGSESVFQSVVAELPTSVTPVRLYDSYLDGFRMTAGGAV